MIDFSALKEEAAKERATLEEQLVAVQQKLQASIAKGLAFDLKEMMSKLTPEEQQQLSLIFKAGADETEKPVVAKQKPVAETPPSPSSDATTTMEVRKKRKRRSRAEIEAAKAAAAAELSTNEFAGLPMIDAELPEEPDEYDD